MPSAPTSVSPPFHPALIPQKLLTHHLLDHLPLSGMLWGDEPCLLGSMMLTPVPRLPQATKGCPACSAWGRRQRDTCQPSPGLGSSHLASCCSFPGSVPHCADAVKGLWEVTTTSLLQVKSWSPSWPLQARCLCMSSLADEPPALEPRQVAFPRDRRS